MDLAKLHPLLYITSILVLQARIKPISAGTKMVWQRTGLAKVIDRLVTDLQDCWNSAVWGKQQSQRGGTGSVINSIRTFS